MADQARPVLAAVRGRRHDLEAVLGQVERALAAPGAGRAGRWLAGVRSELSHRRGGFARHVEITEGSGGLHEEIVRRAPRLAPMVARLQDDHAAIGRAIEERLAAIPEDAGDDERVADTREAVLALLARLTRHRQSGADLIYEAYSVDIGSGD